LVNVSKSAMRESSFFIKVELKDSAGSSVTPTSLSWTLVNEIGAVVNSKNAQVLTPASAMYILLEGDDLAIQDEDNESEIRYILLTGVYDDIRKSGAVFKDTIMFSIINPIPEVASLVGF